MDSFVSGYKNQYIHIYALSMTLRKSFIDIGQTHEGYTNKSARKLIARLIGNKQLYHQVANDKKDYIRIVCRHTFWTYKFCRHVLFVQTH